MNKNDSIGSPTFTSLASSSVTVSNQVASSSLNPYPTQLTHCSKRSDQIFVTFEKKLVYGGSYAFDSMKFTGKTNSTATLPATGSNLRVSHRATIRLRKPKPSLTLHRRSGRRRSRPETPLSKWNVEDRNNERCEGDDRVNRVDEWSRILREERRTSDRPDTVRRLAAGMWRFHVPDAGFNGGDKRSKNALGFQGRVGSPFLNHQDDKHFGIRRNTPRKNHAFVAATTRGFLHKQEPSIPYPHCAMEGTTKWDPICLDTGDEVNQIYRNVKRVSRQVNDVALDSSVELKLEKARARIEDYEGEKRSQKKKLEQFLRKVSEERAAWRSREHEKVRAILDDMKADMNQEKKTRQRLEVVNQKLVNELADSKLAAKRHMDDFQQERKAREIIEEVCEELTKEIEEDNAEIEALKSESMNLRQEVNDERRMLQMAEVWREEHAQMKLIDAKVTLEEKYSQMNKLVGNLEALLKSRNAITGVKEVREAELLRETVASVCRPHEIKEFTHETANPDDMVLLFEEMNLGEAHDREVKQCLAYSPVSHASKVHMEGPDVSFIDELRHSNALTDQNGEFEEDGSGWETVSHPDEHGSIYSPKESIRSIINSRHLDSNVLVNGTEFQKTPLREIKEVCSVSRRQSKRVSSMAKLWSSLEGMNGRISNGRKGMVSPEKCANKGEFHKLDLVGQWSSPPDSANANVNRGEMKGCIEWPRGAHKNGLKTKLIEAQMGSQKVQLKHVLEHNI